jgi:formate dehydrogenase subunit gamma
MSKVTYVSRYSVYARINHWITAISLILMAISGMALFHPSLYFLTALFGGGEMTRTIHPWIGVVLLISFAILFVRFWRLNLWERNDNVWLGRLRSVLAGRDDDLPEMGKYNAGQKLVFWSMTLLILVLFLSGVAIWDQQYPFFAGTLGLAFTIEQTRVAVLVHAIAAVLAISVWIIHVYAAFWVKGTVSAMTRGQVTGGWGHHRRWLREEVARKRAGRSHAAE